MAIHALTFVLGVWLFQQMSVMPSMWLGLLFFPLIFIFLLRPSCRKWLAPLFSSPKGSVLLTGDVEREVEVALVESDSAGLKSDVLVVPQHGSKTSSTLGFIQAVNPKVAIFTSGYRNRFGHPKSEIVERYVARGIKTYRSDLDGAVLIDIGQSDDLRVVAWRHQARHYWND